jgi:CheY-like chemotaxis protein
MPPALHAPSHPPAGLDPPELHRAIATLLGGLDLVSVAVTGEQPSPTNSPASGESVADDRARYHLAVEQQPNHEAEPTPPPRILLVDDIPAMRVAVRGLLEDADLAVIGEAADGLQAVTMAAQLQPDVVVMDVRMPGLDGLQATKRITGAHPHIRVVVYSVFDSDETQHAARQAGATAFAPKSSPPDQVRAAVLAACQATSTIPALPAAPQRDHPQ